MPGKPPFITRRKSRARYAVGVRYERKVLGQLQQLVMGKQNLELIPAPWFEFCDSTGRRWCQLDGLLLDNSTRAAVIYEVKYQHTPDAWWQLVHLYTPVIRAAYPKHRPVCLCEIVHWYDPAVVWPQPYDLTESPLRIPHANKVAVCIFNPKRRNLLAASGHYDGQGNGEAARAIRLP